MPCQRDFAGIAQHPAQRARTNPEQRQSPQLRLQFAKLCLALVNQPPKDRQDQQAMVEGRTVPPDCRHIARIAPEKRKDEGPGNCQIPQRALPLHAGEAKGRTGHGVFAINRKRSRIRAAHNNVSSAANGTSQP